jgi:hypothetical protein
MLTSDEIIPRLEADSGSFTTRGLDRGVTGGCEKIDFPVTSDPESEKLRVRMPSKRLLRSRHTFPIKNGTLIQSAKSIFSHLPDGTFTIPEAAPRKSQIRTGIGYVPSVTRSFKRIPPLAIG